VAATAVPQTETRNIGWIEEIQGLVVEREDNPE
jgi:hypothetical protein